MEILFDLTDTVEEFIACIKTKESRQEQAMFENFKQWYYDATCGAPLEGLKG